MGHNNTFWEHQPHPPQYYHHLNISLLNNASLEYPNTVTELIGQEDHSCQKPQVPHPTSQPTGPTEVQYTTKIFYHRRKYDHR